MWTFSKKKKIKCGHK